MVVFNLIYLCCAHDDNPNFIVMLSSYRHFSQLKHRHA
nr:MAG TPA: hypothetical protein [Caudoviricetes sp.]